MASARGRQVERGQAPSRARLIISVSGRALVITHMPTSGPIVPPAREGHRRSSARDKRRMSKKRRGLWPPGSEVARGYGCGRVFWFRWKQNERRRNRCLAVEIVDTTPPTEDTHHGHCFLGAWKFSRLQASLTC